MSRESDLQAKLLLIAPERFPDLRLFRRNITKIKIRGKTVRFGIPGQADLYGITRGGLHIECELKSPGKRVKEDTAQEDWANWCKEWGIAYLELGAGKKETDEQIIERWCQEIESALKFARDMATLPLGCEKCFGCVKCDPWRRRIVGIPEKNA